LLSGSLGLNAALPFASLPPSLWELRHAIAAEGNIAFRRPAFQHGERPLAYAALVPRGRYKLLRIICKSDPPAPPATKQPDGQITKSLSSLAAKNIPLSPSGKSPI
jgi:hypothetical protein